MLWHSARWRSPAVHRRHQTVDAAADEVSCDRRDRSRLHPPSRRQQVGLRRSPLRSAHRRGAVFPPHGMAGCILLRDAGACGGRVGWEARISQWAGRGKKKARLCSETTFPTRDSPPWQNRVEQCERKMCVGFVVEFHNYKKRNMAYMGHPPSYQDQKCDLVPPHGDVRSPESKKGKYSKENKKTRSKTTSLWGCPCVENIIGIERSGRYTNRQPYQCTGTHGVCGGEVGGLGAVGRMDLEQTKPTK